MKTRNLLPVVVLTLLTFACTGVPLQIPSLPLQPGEQALGPVTGRSTGIMLFQFIPIGQNGRFKVAYDHAVASKPGATRLTDVSIQESWFWAYVLNGYKFTVTGTAVGPAR